MGALLPRRAVFAEGLCPRCGSSVIAVTSTDRPRRRWKCKICGHCWGTLEVIDSSEEWLPSFLFYLLSEGRLAGYQRRFSELYSLIRGLL